MSIESGLSARVELTVADDDTAVAFGSGSVAVLATPRLLALCEQATVEAIAGHLEVGHTSVGMGVQMEHVMPTAVGVPVTAEATLKEVNGRRLTFTVSATDPRGLIAAGRVTRVIVDVERFMDKTR